MTGSLGEALEARTPKERRLVETVALADRPVPLEVGAHLAGLTETELLATGDHLTSEGLLAQTAEGLIPPNRELADTFTATMGEL